MRDEFKKSGLSEEILQIAEIREVSAETASKLMKYPLPSGGWVVPYYSLSGEEIIFQFKPNEPSIGPDGKPKKYLLPSGYRPRLYLPLPYHIKLHDWKWVIITEGVKKVLKGLQEGLPVLGLQGVWNFLYNRVPIPELDLLSGKDVLLCFDSDVTIKPEVRMALRTLCKDLKRRSCQVKIISLPDGESKVGLDDYIVQQGVEPFHSLIAQALPIDQWEIQRYLTIADQRFEEYLFRYEHPLPSISTGVDVLDARTGGLERGEVSCYAARPGHMKTSLAAITALRAAENKHRVLFLSLEMGHFKMLSRLLALRESHLQNDLRNRRVPLNEVKRLISKWKEEIGTRLLLFADREVPRTPKEILRLAEAIAPDLLIVDHHTHIDYGGSSTDMRHAVANFFKDLKNWSENNEAVALVCCQMSRDIDRRWHNGVLSELDAEEAWQPSISDIAESAGVEREAGLVIFMNKLFEYTHDMDDYNKMICILGKERYDSGQKVFKLTINPEKGEDT